MKFVSQGKSKHAEGKSVHAEECFLKHIEENNIKLPQTIWLTRSPCTKCTKLLLNAYRENDPSKPIYPTVFVADIYTEKENFSISAPPLQA